LITAPRRTPPKGGRAGTRPSRRVAPPQRSFLDRNRVRLLWVGIVAVVLVAGGLVFTSFTQKGYTCLSEWTAPSPAPTVAPGATPLLGFPQDDMTRGHIALGTRVKYTFCPPASGPHYNAPGTAGPITARLYGPNENTVPQNWIHNMEHGGLVVLYRCGSGDNCDANQQAALKAFYDSFPNSPICHLPKGGLGSPVITRFDDMQYPYAALVWDLVLPLNEWDPNAVLDFYAQRGETTNPEKQCAAPTDTPGPSDSTAPSTAPSDVPTTAPSSGAAPTPAGS